MSPNPLRKLALAGALALAGCDRNRAPQHLMMLGWSGQMVMVDVGADVVLATRNITQSPSLGAVRSLTWDGTPVEDIAYDSARVVVFLVLPDKAREDADNPKRYRIVSASVPNLERIAEYSAPDSSRPMLFFDVHRGQLLAQWFTNDSVVVRALTSPALAVARTITQRERSDADIGLLFPTLAQSGQTRLGTAAQTLDGRRIVDPDGAISLDGDTLSAARHTVNVSPARRAELDSSGAQVRPWLWVTSNARDNLLVMNVQPDTQRKTARVFLHNIDGAGKEFPVIDVPVGRYILLDDGRHFLVQEIDGPIRRPMHEIKTTGRVRLYDGATGQQLAEVVDQRLAGPFESVTMVCATPDNQRVYVRLGSAALAVIRFWKKDMLVLRAIADVGAVCMWQ